MNQLQQIFDTIDTNKAILIQSMQISGIISINEARAALGIPFKATHEIPDNVPGWIDDEPEVVTTNAC